MPWSIGLRAQLQPAYLLHSRRYRNTSLILDVYSREHGRLGLVARGVCKPKSAWAAVLQPFQPLIISWAGNGELKTLTHAETAVYCSPLMGTALFAGLYLNELLVRLLPLHDAHLALFEQYGLAIQALSEPSPIITPILRRFEKHLLCELGFALELTRELVSHAVIRPELFYTFSLENGVLPATDTTRGPLFSGKNLMALAKEDWSDDSVLHDAKIIFRTAISALLGNKPLKTRELFF